jgi:uncharacterized protein
VDNSQSGFRAGRDYQVIDTDDGALVFVVGNHRVLRVSADLGERLRAGPSALREDERCEWDMLVQSGFISRANGDRLAESTFRDGASLAINVNLTSICNLGCSYCFADGGDYGRITGKMEASAVDHIFSFIAEHVLPSQAVRFEFFGGEPLLNFPIIQQICARAEVFQRERGTRFIHRISTNLTELPEGCLELFAAKRFIVSVSIDGTAETHDRNRPTKGGKGSFDKILRNCERVRAASDDITLVARMTVVGEHPSLRENVEGLWEHNLFDYFQIYPGVVPAEKAEIFLSAERLLGRGERAPPAAAPMMEPSFLRQLADLVAVYESFFTPDNRFRGVLEYERIVDLVLQGKLAVSFCSAGRNYYTLSPDDSIMPCHRLVGQVRFQTGSGARGLTAPLDAWRRSVDEHPVCGGCWVRYVCGGGCKQESFVATGDLNTPSPELCDYQIKLVENVTRMLARQGSAYRARDRAPLDDLFVSCGRPVVASARVEARAPDGLMHFRSF